MTILEDIRAAIGKIDPGRLGDNEALDQLQNEQACVVNYVAACPPSSPLHGLIECHGANDEQKAWGRLCRHERMQMPGLLPVDQICDAVAPRKLFETGTLTEVDIERFVADPSSDEIVHSSPPERTSAYIAQAYRFVGQLMKMEHSTGEHSSNGVGGSGGAPVPKPDGWTKKELVDQVKVYRSFCGETFTSIRKAAGLPTPDAGGKGQQHKYKNADVRRLIEAVRAGTFRDRKRIVEAWTELLPN